MKAVGLSHIGYCRDNNEDSYFYDEKMGLFILCDGMGGHLGGEVASGLAVQIVKQEVQQNLLQMEPAAALRQAIEKANSVIWKKSHQDDKLREMGTTLTAAFVDETSLIIAHVGDSSLFLFGPQKEAKITHDHTLAESMRQGASPQEKDEFNAYNHILTRALGMDAEVRVDFFIQELDGDETILLASDGLTDLLEEREISEVIQKNLDLRQKAQTLIDTALAKGGYDNITVILVQLHEGGRS